MWRHIGHSGATTRSAGRMVQPAARWQTDRQTGMCNECAWISRLSASPDRETAACEGTRTCHIVGVDFPAKWTCCRDHARIRKPALACKHARQTNVQHIYATMPCHDKNIALQREPTCLTAIFWLSIGIRESCTAHDPCACPIDYWCHFGNCLACVFHAKKTMWWPAPPGNGDERAICPIERTTVPN